MHLCFHRQLEELFRPLLQPSEKFPAAVTIYQFFGQYGYVAYGRLAANSVLYMMSTFILYYLAKNYMSEGFTMSGATKG
jgi:multiple sugar transport system permease protein